MESTSTNDGTTANNNLDIIIRDNIKGIYLLIDTAILEGRNIIQTEEKKILKYRDLTIDTQRLRNIKIKRTGNVRIT
jgi:hypothetical protein